MRRYLVAIGLMIAVLSVFVWRVQAQSQTRPSVGIGTSQMNGRFQLFSYEGAGTFMIDSQTGRVWRYIVKPETETNTPSDGSITPDCFTRGCLAEIDRMKLTTNRNTGWVSEIMK